MAFSKYVDNWAKRGGMDHVQMNSFWITKIQALCLMAHKMLSACLSIMYIDPWPPRQTLFWTESVYFKKLSLSL